MSMPPEPPELRRLTGRRRPPLSAALFVLVIIVVPLSLLGIGSVVAATRTVDAYRATHDGVKGVLTVEWSTRRLKGGYVTSGSFVSGDGAVRRLVTLDGDGRHRPDQMIPAELSGAHASVAYPRHSHVWIGDAVATLITGGLVLAGSVLLLRTAIGRTRHR
ncbi:hypothetical protein NE236_09125 [Actinoallomurus purpureus]|uniref:hypothetical protein n=1 Tax=Actinoallomurus purpureus TaxID=478114 RepID=UPI0020924AF8|nr:hypothetical protein [Actinoallomurus purpureus]MCO6005145.1 hypothetical protein [Actinoallomurus purpureus]